jgi:hypothetical protein
LEPEDRRFLLTIRGIVLVSAFLGLVLGYVLFYGIYPMLSFPATPDPSLGAIVLALAVAALLGGLATEELKFLIAEVFVSLFVGGGVATAMLLTPSLTGTVLTSAADIPFYVLQIGFPFLLLGLLMNFVFGLIGLAVRESVLLRYRRFEPPSWAANRK